MTPELVLWTMVLPAWLIAIGLVKCQPRMNVNDVMVSWLCLGGASLVLFLTCMVMAKIQPDLFWGITAVGTVAMFYSATGTLVKQAHQEVA